MYIALGAMVFNLLVILYFFPVEVFNHAKNKRNVCYLCQPAFWRTCCRDQEELEIAGSDDASENFQPTARLLDHDEHPLDSEKQDPNKVLTPDELKMHENGDYEGLTGKEDFENTLKLIEVTRKIKEKAVLDNISLTMFMGESFVFVGENGSGKTMALKSIAGFHEGLEGKIIACGLQLKESELRFMDDLIAFQTQHHVTIF